MGAEDNTAYSGYSSFADVELLLDKEGDKHKQRGEATKDNVRIMRSVDAELVPSHNLLRYGRRRSVRVVAVIFGGLARDSPFDILIQEFNQVPPVSPGK